MPDRKPPNPVTAYIPAVTLGKPSVYLHPDGYAVVSWTDPQTFKRLLSMHVETAQQGRELAQVFASASMMLDPAAPLHLAAEAVADAEMPPLDDDDLDDGMDDRFDGPHDAQPDDIPQVVKPPTFGDLPWFCEEKCGRCGSGEFLVCRDGVWVCWNTANCTERQAAKAGAK